MARTTFQLGLAGLICLSTASAHAAQRTFVASTGSDGNPCSRTAPCRNFTAAITAVDVGGEVVVLDSAGYGPFTVTKSVSVIAPAGVFAGVTAFSGAAVTVNAASSVVVLRGLSLNGLVDGHVGILYSVGAVLHVESCTISGFIDFGIEHLAGSAQLFVKDTVVRENGDGLVVAPGAGVANASVERSRFQDNADAGILVFPGGLVSVKATVSSGNAVGFCADAASGSAELNITDSVASGNGNVGMGCIGGTGAITRVGSSMSTNNGIGFDASNTCLFESLRNNLVRGNTADVSGAITTVTGQ